jgi:hypothetical protein
MLAQPLAHAANWDQLARRQASIYISGLATTADSSLPGAGPTRAQFEAGFTRRPVEPGYHVTHLDEIDTICFPNEPLPNWKPLRRELGITAFGTNAYVALQFTSSMWEENFLARGVRD